MKEIRRLRCQNSALIQSSPDAFWFAELKHLLLLDLPEDEMLERVWSDAIITECNAAFARMYGYRSPADLVGTHLMGFVARRDARNLEAITRFCRSPENVLEVDTHQVDRDNNPHCFRNTVWKFTEQGCLIAAFGKQRDISDEKLIEQEKRNLLRTLTQQQKELMRLIGLNDNIKLIANKLKITEKTAYTERDRLKRKFKLSHTDDLRPLAWRLGFIPTDLSGLRFALLSDDDVTDVP